MDNNKINATTYVGSEALTEEELLNKAFNIIKRKENKKELNLTEITLEEAMDLSQELEETKGSMIFLVTGYFMSWHGKQEGGMIVYYETLREVMSRICLYETEEGPRVFIRDDGIIIIEETHHDSPVVPSHYEIRIVTKKGKQLINEEDDELSPRELHQLLLNTPGCLKPVVTKSKIKEVK